MRSAPCPKSHHIDSFGKVAPYYDILLDIITIGQYAKFLKKALEVLAPKTGERILDLCSGTGRVASWMARAVGKDGEVIGMDWGVWPFYKKM
ncbi:MAG: class I SAM-dependent methyltransferase [Thermodesulfobacteriota bacterium]